MIVGGIVCVCSSLYCLSVELRACAVVYSDCWWNCLQVQSFIVIIGGISVVFNYL